MWSSRSKGTARTTFVAGALLTLPGASYLIGLDGIAKQDSSTAGTAAMVLGFNLVMLMLLELPLIGYALAPDWTPQAVTRFRNWFNRNAHVLAFRLRSRNRASAGSQGQFRVAMSRSADTSPPPPDPASHAIPFLGRARQPSMMMILGAGYALAWAGLSGS